MAVVLSLLSVHAAAPPRAEAFQIGIKLDLPWWPIEVAQPIHEGITKDAIAVSDIDVGPNFLTNLNAGVVNTDWRHQFDEAAHFDNSSVARDVGFEGGFHFVRINLLDAYDAVSNPEFRNPSFESFKEIVDEARALLRSAVQRCSSAPSGSSCDWATKLHREVNTLAPILTVNANPDPHDTLNPDSIFGSAPSCLSSPVLRQVCAVTSDLSKDQRLLVDRVQIFFDQASSAHEDLFEGWKEKIKAGRQKVHAYLAFQSLGHALHATQDFFAHSNYVELMTGTKVGSAIATANPPWRPSQVTVPRTSEFSRAGLARVMAGTPGAYEKLETGYVVATWLEGIDACASPKSVIFNPALLPWAIPETTFLGVTIPSWTIGMGFNPRPKAGFGYCHYKTGSTMGLNKDNPCRNDPRNVTRPADCDEPSHVNFVYARRAALKMSANLLRSLFATPPQLPPLLRRHVR